MPVIENIDKKSGEPIRRFIGTAANYRLQLAALPDEKDSRTGQIIKGRNLVAQFRRGIYETNKPEIIELIEGSLAYGTDVKDYDALLNEGKERRYADLLAMAKDDPEMMERLRKDLDKRPTKAQKEKAQVIKESIEAEVQPAVA